ncbi:hypothetical protein FH972_002482 [Carpinus fangiana]|uniref:Uncharacterized protein n=1 Tax=Carpinus fangiana TaxID=176857 RepID=A0A5N6QGV6_9ROSI|nr:hypothetical protein FH972_002482 [Carpinus fangiana]
MLLRSSSTPVLGSLLPSYSDSPNNNSFHYETNTTIKHPPTIIHPNHNKLPLHPTGSLKLSSCSSSPISPSIAEALDRNKGFRRAQSEGNLEGLACISCNNNEDQFCEMNPHKKFLSRPMCSMLQTIPSFQGGREEDEEESDFEDDEERTELEENEELLERIMAMEAQTSNLENKTKNMNLTEVNANESWNMGFGDVELFGQEMFLARGLGIDGSGGGGGGGREFNSAGFGGDGGDNPDVEGHYKKLVEENPGNPLFLRNYAQFLYQTKRDLQGAEENYSRAIIADPKDGEILSQYAKLVWELHHDQDRASSYFERAVQASPEDSHVQAAYANFLWESEDYEDGCDVSKDLEAMPPHFHAAVASASA